ncbi:MAG TPA: hypothetical protein VJC10_01565 [Patescibacteria group bacterium]|nr:hypothetical protein [Patescibacteria group bacterium]
MASKLEYAVQYPNGTIETRSKIIPSFDRNAPDGGKSSIFPVHLLTQNTPRHIDSSKYPLKRDRFGRWQFSGNMRVQQEEVVLFLREERGKRKELHLSADDYSFGLPLTATIDGNETQVTMFPADEPVEPIPQTGTLLDNTQQRYPGSYIPPQHSRRRTP